MESATAAVPRGQQSRGIEKFHSLLEQPDGRQGREDEIAQIAIGDVERIMDAALMAETAQSRVVMRQFRPDNLGARAASHWIVDLVFGFAVDQGQAAIGERRIDFVAATGLGSRRCRD